MGNPSSSGGVQLRPMSRECQSDEGGIENLDAAHWVGAVKRGAEGSHMQLQDHLCAVFQASFRVEWGNTVSSAPKVGKSLSGCRKFEGQTVFRAVAHIIHMV